MTSTAARDEETANPRDSQPLSAPGNLQANFGLLAFHHVLIRVGWIFKTESIVMPAVLDLIGGAGWLRGFLPMLSRFGSSVPPLLVSLRISASPVKKHWLAVSSMAMGVCFLFLSMLWMIVGTKLPHWLPWAFLVIYGVFFVSTGINQLANSTLQGKLVPADRRGGLMWVANVFGSVLSIACAWFLLRQWLKAEDGNFVAIFGISGVMFLLAGFVAFWLVEHRDPPSSRPVRRTQFLAAAWNALRRDADFRLVVIVAGCFGMSITLFPHYQALALQRLESDLTWLIPWLVAQNLGVGIISIPAGWLADRLGNLIVLRIFMGILCVPPLLSLWLTQFSYHPAALYSIVFVLLGATPISMRLFKNLTLELTSTENHPTYVSTMILGMAIPPILTSWLVGLLIDLTSFELAFSLVLLFIVVGWILTWKLKEPRHSTRIDLEDALFQN